MAHRLLSAGQGAALLVTGSVVGARVAQILTGVAMARCRRSVATVTDGPDRWIGRRTSG